MKKLCLLLVTLFIAFAGCKKDKNEQAIADNKLILAYIQANNLTAKATGTGLYYVVTTPGDATRPIITSTVYVKYRGYLLNGTNKGTQFDSSYESSEQPTQFVGLTTLVKGFSEGLKLFGKGGKGQLIIPSGLGYGATASGSVPANSVLIFDIELVTFQ
jgi:FKBP-type peptidyl-prolyl cis-trans isomerase FkpA